MKLSDIWGASEDPQPAIDRSVVMTGAMRYINDWVNNTALPEERIAQRLGLTNGEFDSIRHYKWEDFDRNQTMRELLLDTVQTAANCWCTAPMKVAKTSIESMSMLNAGLNLVSRGFE